MSSCLKWDSHTVEYIVGIHETVEDVEGVAVALLIALCHLELSSGSDGKVKPPRPLQPRTMHLLGILTSHFLN